MNTLSTDPLLVFHDLKNDVLGNVMNGILYNEEAVKSTEFHGIFLRYLSLRNHSIPCELYINTGIYERVLIPMENFLAVLFGDQNTELQNKRKKYQFFFKTFFSSPLLESKIITEDFSSDCAKCLNFECKIQDLVQVTPQRIIEEITPFIEIWYQFINGNIDSFLDFLIQFEEKLNYVERTLSSPFSEGVYRHFGIISTQTNEEYFPQAFEIIHNIRDVLTQQQHP